MKKLFCTALIGMFAILLFNKAYAAFPVRTEKAITTKNSKESLKISIKEAQEEIKSELEEPAASSAAAGGGSKQVIAAILCFFLGGFGIHDFVLGNTKKGLLHLGLFALGLILFIVGIAGYVSGAGVSLPVLALIGYLILVGNGIWAFVDFIRILVGKYPGV